MWSATPVGFDSSCEPTKASERSSGLIEKAESGNIWEKIEALKKGYRKKCPECGKEFWVEERLIETSLFHGGFNGYRCPDPDCNGIVKPEDEA